MGNELNWEAIGAIGEVLGAITVALTLIYLVVQLRQNTKALRLSTANAVTEELQAMWSLLASDKGLTEVIIKAGQSKELDTESKVRYYTFTSNTLRIYENAYLQKIEGSIHEAHWIGLTRMMIDYTDMPAFSSYWADRKHWGSDEFAEHMESEIISTPAKQGVSVPGAYT